MNGVQVFYWRDERIADPRAWARARGEDWVHYNECRRRSELVGECICPWVTVEDDDYTYQAHGENPLCTATYREVIDRTPGQMPAAFFDTRCQRGETWLEEVRREKA